MPRRVVDVEVLIPSEHGDVQTVHSSGRFAPRAPRSRASRRFSPLSRGEHNLATRRHFSPLSTMSRAMDALTVESDAAWSRSANSRNGNTDEQRELQDLRHMLNRGPNEAFIFHYQLMQPSGKTVRQIETVPGNGKPQSRTSVLNMPGIKPRVPETTGYAPVVSRARQPATVGSADTLKPTSLALIPGKHGAHTSARSIYSERSTISTARGSSTAASSRSAATQDGLDEASSRTPTPTPTPTSTHRLGQASSRGRLERRRHL